MLLHPTNILLAAPNAQHFFEFFPDVVRYFHSRNTIVPCHQIVTVLLSSHFNSIVSQGATGLDLLMSSAWDLRSLVTLRLNTVFTFWNFIPLQKTTNKTKSSLHAQIHISQVKLQVTTCIQFKITQHNYCVPLLPTLITFYYYHIITVYHFSS